MHFNPYTMLTGTRFKLNKQLLIFFWGVTPFALFSSHVNAQKLHIDSIGCQVNETDTSYLNKMIRHEGQFYNSIFGAHVNDTVSINVTLYGKSKAYTNALKANKAKNTGNGIYVPALNATLAYKNDLFMHVILRAANATLLRYNYPDAPRWLVEGTNAVMSFIDETGDRQVIYTPSFDDNRQIKALTWGEEGIDLDALFANDNPDWDSKTAIAKLRTLSFGIIYFLVTQQKDHVAPIIWAMKKGQTTREAIASSFGSFDNFKDKFTLYYRYNARSKFSKAE